MGISPLGLKFPQFEQIDRGVKRIDLDQRRTRRVLRLFVAAGVINKIFSPLDVGKRRAQMTTKPHESACGPCHVYSVVRLIRSVNLFA
jgi:hypothetical protein